MWMYINVGEEKNKNAKNIKMGKIKKRLKRDKNVDRVST